MAATQGTDACRHGQDGLLRYKPSIRIGKKGDLSDIAWLLVPGWSEYFQKLLINLDFHKQQSLRFTENGPKKKKNIQRVAVL